MGRKNYKALISFSLLIAFAACKKDTPVSSNSLPVQDTGNVYITCEGNFGNGDASLYIYQPAKDSVYGDVYKAANNQSLGDVLQSLQVIDSRIFLCVNNSNKVVVINKKDFTVIGTIPISQPRYILPVSSTKAYVSSLYSNRLYVLNTLSLQIADSIIMPYKNTEGMCLYNGFAYVCPWDTACKNIYKLDINTDQIVQVIPVSGYAPTEIAMDKENKMWVLSGDQAEGKKSFLTKLDPATGNIVSSYQFDSAASPMRLTFNKTADTLYFIEANYYGGTAYNGIYRMPINAAALPNTAFIQAGVNQYFYGLGIDPVTNYIYVGDPKGFVQKGVAYIYKPDGSLTHQFATGVGPSHFYFD